MFKRIASFSAALVLSLSSLFVFAPLAHAAVITWDGGGSDNNFSTAANWSADTVPSNGDSLVFPTSVDSDTIEGDDRILNNDISSLTVSGIQVTGNYITGDYDSYRLTGNAFSSSGNILGNDVLGSYPYIYIVPIVTFTANATAQSVSFVGGVNIGSNTVTLQSSFVNGTYSGTGGSLVMSGFEGGRGAGGGCGYTPGVSSPSFASPITINQYGSLLATSNNQDVAYSATNITLNNGGYFGIRVPFNQDLTFDTPLTLNGGTISADQNGDEANDCAEPTTKKLVTISSDVTLTADTTFAMYDVDIKFTGTVTGKQYIKAYFASSGNVLFNDGTSITPVTKTSEYSANSPSTSIYVNNNEIAVVTGTYGNTSIGDGGILKGTGTVGTLSVYDGGKLAPGLSPGCLNSGNLTFAQGSTYEFEVGGTTECTEYDQTKVTGGVTLGNGTLSFVRYNDFKPVKDQTYKIIDNDASDAVTGTFLNLAEGATFTVDGYVLKISYVGGDGNDVVLTVQSVPAVPDTGFKLLQSNPMLTLISTTVLAGAMMLIAKKYGRSFNR